MTIAADRITAAILSNKAFTELILNAIFVHPLLYDLVRERENYPFSNIGKVLFCPINASLGSILPMVKWWSTTSKSLHILKMNSFKVLL